MGVIHFLRRHRILTFAVPGVIAAIAGIVLIPRGLPAAQPPPTTRATGGISALQRQRIETLQQASETARRLYQSGLVDYDQVIRFDRALLDAQLELDASVDEQIKLLQKSLDHAKQQEDLLSQKERAGLTTPLTSLDAKAERLRIEIMLSKMAGK